MEAPKNMKDLPKLIDTPLFSHVTNDNSAYLIVRDLGRNIYSVENSVDYSEGFVVILDDDVIKYHLNFWKDKKTNQHIERKDPLYNHQSCWFAGIVKCALNGELERQYYGTT